jgi:uncharacterized protein (DUF1697 family)
MRTHVALLRGINVGGNRKVAMSDLREITAALGHTEVATYIQSGNVVFSAASPDADPERLAAELEDAIAARLTFRPPVIVLSRAGLTQAVRDNPFPDEPSPKYVHAVFRRGDLADDAAPAVAAAQQRAADKGSRDEAAIVGRTLYLHTPDGLGRSILAAELNRAGPAATTQRDGTARNWATVTKLMAMLDE